MKAFKKVSITFLLILSLLVLLAGCRSSNSSSSGDKKVTLEFTQWWASELPKGALQKIVDDFTDKTGIKIKLQTNPFADTKKQIASSSAVGESADVVGLDGSWVYDFAKQGNIANLSEQMDKIGYSDNNLANQVKVNGDTYMIPVVNFAYPMFVNKDLLKKAGIKDVPKTRSEFLKATKQIKKKTNKAGWAIPLSTEPPSGIQNNFMSWLWANGGHMLKNGKPSLTDNKKLIGVVEFQKKLFDSGVVESGAKSMKETDMVESFINGRVGFMIDSLAHISDINNGAKDMDYDVAPVPVKDGYSEKSGIDVAMWGVGISKDSKHKKEAMEFIKYLMSKKVNKKLAVKASGFPGNSEAKPDYSDEHKIFQKAYRIFNNSKPINEFAGLPTSDELKRQFDQEFQRYLDDEQKSVSNMLEKIQEKWNEKFK